jgi:predicted acyltransferase
MRMMAGEGARESGLQPAGRLMALDVFRGATIAAMILVNNPGDGPAAYRPLQHSEWNGWTPTDLVFPFFLFIVGVAMAFSFRSRRERGASRERLMTHAVWRSLILFGLGMFLNGFPDHYQLASWRVYGVLQRIAVCYLITSVLALWTKRRGQVFAVLACLVGYWIVMRYIPVPGFGVPGRDIPLLDPDRNLAAWLDRKLLFGHLWEITRDPEGVLSTIPAVATCLLGLLTGEWLGSDRSPRTKMAAMAGAGLLCGATGELLSLWFPINKSCGPVRTSSSPPDWRCSVWPCVTGFSTSGDGVAGVSRSWCSARMRSRPTFCRRCWPPGWTRCWCIARVAS